MGDRRQQIQAVIGSTSGGGGGSGTPPTTPLIYNLPMASANTEYSQALPGTVKKFTVKLRSDAAFRLAYGAGETATQYLSVPKGCSATVDLIEFTAGTLYIRSPQAGQVAEIETWS